MIGKKLIVSLVIIMLVSLFSCGNPGSVQDENQVVLIPDTNLEMAIREILSKSEGPIHRLDMASIANIEAERREIANLNGLEYCTNLESLNLSANPITDISPLSSLELPYPSAILRTKYQGGKVSLIYRTSTP